MSIFCVRRCAASHRNSGQTVGDPTTADTPIPQIQFHVATTINFRFSMASFLKTAFPFSEERCGGKYPSRADTRRTVTLVGKLGIGRIWEDEEAQVKATADHDTRLRFADHVRSARDHAARGGELVVAAAHDIVG